MKLPSNVLNLLNHFGFEISNFEPICYYDENLDELVIQLKDCSFTEHSTATFSFFMENHTTGRDIVGLRIFNIKRMYKKYGLSDGRINILAKVLRILLADDIYPDGNKIDFVFKCKEIGLKYENIDLIKNS